jgi:hypothetical protein
MSYITCSGQDPRCRSQPTAHPSTARTTSITCAPLFLRTTGPLDSASIYAIITDLRIKAYDIIELVSFQTSEGSATVYCHLGIAGGKFCNFVL